MRVKSRDLNAKRVILMDIDIKNYEFHPRQINRNTWETILVDKLSGNRFGCNYQFMNPASHEMIFEEFKKNQKNFFIDIAAEIISDEIKLESTPVEKVEGVVNSEI